MTVLMIHRYCFRERDISDFPLINYSNGLLSSYPLGLLLYVFVCKQ